MNIKPISIVATGCTIAISILLAKAGLLPQFSLVDATMSQEEIKENQEKLELTRPAPLGCADVVCYQPATKEQIDVILNAQGVDRNHLENFGRATGNPSSPSVPSSNPMSVAH